MNDAERAIASSPEAWKPADPDLLEPALAEIGEALGTLSTLSLRLEKSPDDRDTVHAMFRAAHNLKGIAGMLAARKMELLARRLEDVLESLRKGALAPGPDVVDRILQGTDGCSRLAGAMRTGEVLAEDVSTLAAGLESVLEGAPPGGTSPPPPPPPSRSAAPSAVPESRRAEAATAALPVRLGKVNQILNLVGELVIRRTGLGERTRNLNRLQSEMGKAAESLRAGRDPSPEEIQEVGRHLRRIRSAFGAVCEHLEGTDLALDRILAQLQDEAVRMRMVPVSELFAAVPRIVRDVSRTLGKSVDLATEGEETELDKVICDHLTDPLLHLVRNALDHGIETPAERRAAHKGETGTLTLAARHEGGKVVLETSDDGRGIDPGRIREAAVRKGIVPAERAASLTEADLYDLLFQPGFSTARAVTDLSGRGVGLDVVRSEVAAVDGQVSVRSEAGRGTTFRIEVPLTLATLQVLFVRHRSEVFAVPTASIREVVPIAPGDLESIGGSRRCAWRGVRLPVLPLDELLGMERAAWAETTRPLLVTSHPERPAGLLVDAYLHRRTVVMKSLGTLLKQAPAVLGTTILGDGRVVVVLDPDACARLTAAAPAASTRIAAADARGGAPSILLVEDSGVVRKRLADILIRAGYDVTEAKDGAEALACAEGRSFDLVSTDVVMPRIDGYELTRRLRTLAQFQSVPILMVTSKEDELDRVRGFDAGADDYILKPVHEETYLARIRRHLGGNR
ncbi:MAG: response regulator [Planctomycetes bacterium]|nr:response regulator [Planctomycetota bacterium]